MDAAETRMARRILSTVLDSVVDVMDEFERWWVSYPHRVGKLAAKKAYDKAHKIARAEDLLSGVTRYIETKPTWQAWAHPASWLNAGRWLDEIPVPTVYVQWTCAHEPRCPHRAACQIVAMRKTG